jgi:hypothetical protein
MELELGWDLCLVGSSIYPTNQILYIKATWCPSVRPSVWTKIGQCLEDSFSHCPFPVECFGGVGQGRAQ